MLTIVLIDLLKASFHVSGKTQMIGDSTVSQPSQIISSNENCKLHVDDMECCLDSLVFLTEVHLN